MYQNFIIPYLYEARHVTGDTPPIIRSLNLHWQPLVFHTWKVVGRVVGGRCQAHNVPDSLWFFIGGRLFDVQLVDVFKHCTSMCLTTFTNYTSNKLPRVKNQGLPVQF